jgi:hypothetical protein
LKTIIAKESAKGRSVVKTIQGHRLQLDPGTGFGDASQSQGFYLDTVSVVSEAWVPVKFIYQIINLEI